MNAPPKPAGRARRSRPKPDTVKMDVPRPLHPRIVAIRDQIAADTGMSTTLPDAWLKMVEYWEQGHRHENR